MVPISAAIPTDNLYKFLALFGLLILAFFLAFPFYQIYKVELTIIDLEKESALIKYRLTTLASKTDGLEDAINTILIALENDQNIADEYIAGKYESYENLRSQNLQAVELVEEFRAKSAKLSLSVREIERLAYLAFIGVPIGFFMSLSGFYLWYTRLQKYIDKRAIR